MEQRLRGAINAIKGVKIPDLPKEIMELDAALSSKFPNNQQITEIIKSNTKLSGDVIRIVNSPIMKLKTPVKSVREAVDVLGYNNLKNLVLSAALQNLFNTREVQEIIEHSKDVAFCCAELSDYVHDVSRDEAYLMGLFHNGGCLLLATKDPEHYLKMFSLINTNPVSGIQKEIERYGAAHTDVGILIGQKWKLPVEMLNVIMLHHLAHSNVGQERVRAMLALVKVANVIVNEVSFGTYMTDEARQYMAEAQAELMLTNDVINGLRRTLISSG
ncbi:MAG: HDOD domain-containing protein [Hydrogenovibrio sp.]